MSNYEQLSEKQPVARKQHRCIWCPEPIDIGTKHIHEVSKYDGEFQDHRWNLECHAAMQREYDYGDDNEFDPHSHDRGTADEYRPAKVVEI
jgi:hypothetical protein